MDRKTRGFPRKMEHDSFWRIKTTTGGFDLPNEKLSRLKIFSRAPNAFMRPPLLWIQSHFLGMEKFEGFKIVVNRYEKVGPFDANENRKRTETGKTNSGPPMFFDKKWSPAQLWSKGSIHFFQIFYPPISKIYSKPMTRMIKPPRAL